MSPEAGSGPLEPIQTTIRRGVRRWQVVCWAFAVGVGVLAFVCRGPIRDATVGPPTYTLDALDRLADLGQLPHSATVEADEVVNPHVRWTYRGTKGDVTGDGAVVRLRQAGKEVVALVDPDDTGDRAFSGVVETELRENTDDGGEFSSSDRSYLLEGEQLFRDSVIVWILAPTAAAVGIVIGRRALRLRSRGKRSYAARLEPYGGLEQGFAVVDTELAAPHLTIAPEDGKDKREPIRLTEHWLVRRRGAVTVLLPLETITGTQVTKGRVRGAWWWQVVVSSTAGPVAFRFAHRREAADDCAAVILRAADERRSPA